VVQEGTRSERTSSARGHSRGVIRPRSKKIAVSRSVCGRRPGSELFTEHTVLLLKTVVDIALLLVEPAGERDHDELQGMRLRRHGDSLSEAEFIEDLAGPFGVDPVFGQYADTLLAACAP